MSRRFATAVTAVVTTVILTSVAAGGAAAPGKQLPVDVTPPTISGTATVGSGMTAAPGTWSGKGLRYSNQWLRCDSTGASCGAITGASNWTYGLSAAASGATFRVIVTATNRNGSTAATSAATSVVSSTSAVPSPGSTAAPPPAIAPSNTSPPTVSGTAQQGLTVNGSAGSWSGTSPIAYTYQWQHCDSAGVSCSPVSGATSSSYLLASADIGSTLRVSVTASNSSGSATAASAPTGLVSAAPSQPIGTVTYKADWEYGQGGLYQGLDPSQWSHQCADNTPGVGERGTYTAVTGDTDSGTYAGRFDLPASTSSTACEALHSRVVGPLGSDDYYGVALKFPLNWQAPQPGFWGMALSQFNYEGINGSPLALGAQANSVELTVNSGDCPPLGGSTGCPYWSGVGGVAGRPATVFPNILYAIPPGQLILGVWHELIVRVRWTLDLDGIVEVWHRIKGETTWTKTVSASGGFPTLQTGTNFVGYTVTRNNIATYGTNDKFGAYRGSASYPISVYQDDWCRATSFSAASSCLAP